MARLARIVAPGTPHFITQRGANAQDVFFDENDAHAYIDLLAVNAEKAGLEIWAWCLLRSRVHLLAVPSHEDSLRAAFGETHRLYSQRINARTGSRGNIWHARFSSFPLSGDYVLPAAHFIEMTPVMAGLCRAPGAFRWSSARAHIAGTDDALCRTSPLCGLVDDWEDFLRKGVNVGRAQKLMGHMRTGRPLGDADFIAGVEAQTGRSLQKKKPGRKKHAAAQAMGVSCL